MTDEMKPQDEQPEETSSQPYEPAEEYNPPSAEPPEGMTDATPSEVLFELPKIDASSFEGAEPQPVEAAESVEPAAPPEPFAASQAAPAQQPFTPAQPSGFPPASAAAPAKGGVKWWVILIIVLAVLCCCCVVIGAVLWQYGDQIFSDYFDLSIILGYLAV